MNILDLPSEIIFYIFEKLENYHLIYISNVCILFRDLSKRIFTDNHKNFYTFNEQMAAHGYLSLLKWGRERAYWDRNKIVKAAIQNSQINVLKYLKDEYPHFKHHKIDALLSFSVPVFEFFLENGCNFTRQDTSFGIFEMPNFLEDFSNKEERIIESLRFLESKKIEVHKINYKKLSFIFAKRGDKQVIDHLVKDYDENLCCTTQNQRIMGGNFSLKCPGIMCNAFYSLNFELVESLISRGYKIKRCCCETLITWSYNFPRRKYGEELRTFLSKIEKLMSRNKHNEDEKDAIKDNEEKKNIALSILINDLESLKSALSHTVLNSRDISLAIFSNLEVFKYVFEKYTARKEIHPIILDYIADNGRLDILKYLMQKIDISNYVSSMLDFAIPSRMEFATFLIENFKLNYIPKSFLVVPSLLEEMLQKYEGSCVLIDNAIEEDIKSINNNYFKSLEILVRNNELFVEKNGNVLGCVGLSAIHLNMACKYHNFKMANFIAKRLKDKNEVVRILNKNSFPRAIIENILE